MFHWTLKSADGETVTLKKLKPNHFRLEPCDDGAIVRFGAIIDVETTGLSHETDSVIEIGLRVFAFNRNTGALASLLDSYSEFQDPGVPLTPEIIQLTGITDEMVKGKKIDWNEVDRLLSKCQVVIAHNAAFDRPFIDRSSPISKNKIWACSFQQIDWAKKGFTSSKLEVLSIFHGFFTDAHRALQDSDALLYLLSQKDEGTKQAYLAELLSKAREPSTIVSALYSAFETKDILKAAQYRWEANQKCWTKEVPNSAIEAEVRFLEEKVYSGKFKGKLSEIQPVDRFKAPQR